MELWPEYRESIADKSNQHAVPRASGKDGTNDGGPADMSTDETLEYSALFRDLKTATRTEKYATPGDGKDQSEHARKTSSRTTTRDGSTAPRSVTVKEAATMLGLSETYVRELRNNKKLRSSGRNKKLILVSSVKAYQESRQKTGQNESDERQEIPHQNGNGTGHSDAALHLDEYTHVAAQEQRRNAWHRQPMAQTD